MSETHDGEFGITLKEPCFFVCYGSWYSLVKSRNKRLVLLVHFFDRSTEGGREPDPGFGLST